MTTTARDAYTRRAGQAGAGALAIVLLLAAAAPDAHGLDFKLHWRPNTAGTKATGYRLYVRQQGTGYGNFVPVPPPSPATDGSMIATMTGLAVGPRYYFAVSAVDASGAESGLSNEVGTCTTDFQCDDNDPCTADTCTLGVCRNGPVADGTSCADNNRCNGEEKCQHGTCTRGATLVCDDGNACTKDSCNPSSGCVSTPSGDCHACTTASQCDDNNPCTTDSCTPRGTCTNVLTSGCSRCTADDQCNDRNPCTADKCNNGRCQSTQRPPGASCSDGDRCNGEETCQGGRCKATGFPCDDGNSCTADICEPQGGCSHVSSVTCEECDGMPRGEFQATTLSFVPSRGGERLSAVGLLEPVGPIDPSSTGVRLEIGDTTGGVYYRVSVPPDAFKTSPSGRSIRMNRKQRSLRRDGLKRLDMTVTPDGMVRVFLRVNQKAFGAEFPKAYTWTMMFGTQCGVSDCFLHPRHALCR